MNDDELKAIIEVHDFGNHITYDQVDNLINEVKRAMALLDRIYDALGCPSKDEAGLMAAVKQHVKTENENAAMREVVEAAEVFAPDHWARWAWESDGDYSYCTSCGATQNKRGGTADHGPSCDWVALDAALAKLDGKERP